MVYRRLFAAVAGLLVMMFTLSIASPAHAYSDFWTSYRTCAVTGDGDYSIRVHLNGTATGYQPWETQTKPSSSADYPPPWNRLRIIWKKANTAQTVLQDITFDVGYTAGSANVVDPFGYSRFTTQPTYLVQVEIGYQTASGYTKRCRTANIVS